MRRPRREGSRRGRRPSSGPTSEPRRALSPLPPASRLPSPRIWTPRAIRRNFILAPIRAPKLIRRERPPLNRVRRRPRQDAFPLAKLPQPNPFPRLRLRLHLPDSRQASPNPPSCQTPPAAPPESLPDIRSKASPIPPEPSPSFLSPARPYVFLSRRPSAARTGRRKSGGKFAKRGFTCRREGCKHVAMKRIPQWNQRLTEHHSAPLSRKRGAKSRNPFEINHHCAPLS
jgi:hypothetical protein